MVLFLADVIMALTPEHRTNAIRPTDAGLIVVILAACSDLHHSLEGGCKSCAIKDKLLIIFD